MKIILLKNKARNNQIDKTAFFEYINSVNGEYRGVLDLDEPKFHIKKDSDIPPNFNYIYVVELNTYYYVKHIDIVNKELYTIFCHIDVLMTFRDEIYNFKAFIKRNEFSYEDNENVRTSAKFRKRITDNMAISTQLPRIVENSYIENNFFNTYMYEQENEDVPEVTLNEGQGSYILNGLGVNVKLMGE